MSEWKTYDKVVDGLDNLTWYNGLAEILQSWKGENPYIYKDNYGQLVRRFSSMEPCDLSLTEIQEFECIWVIAVSMFGNYGTSPRFGWIEKEHVEEFYDFLDDITKIYRESKELDLW